MAEPSMPQQALMALATVGKQGRQWRVSVFNNRRGQTLYAPQYRRLWMWWFVPEPYGGIGHLAFDRHIDAVEFARMFHPKNPGVSELKRIYQ